MSEPTRSPDARANPAGFTLIELMITVAIISILATVAIPQLLNMQMRARRSEAFINVKGLAIAQSAYYQLHEDFVACSVSPTTPLNRQSYNFDASLAGWQEVGWTPDGKVRCHYNAQRFTNGNGTWVRPAATCDMDDDNVIATWWMDVDPRRTSASSQHMVLRPNGSTTWQTVW
jgi:prepilin-type N-terminal cleavage/methylation domain-containing protein